MNPITVLLNELPTSNPSTTWRTIAFQGQPGAYAHIAAQTSCPHAQPIPCESFAAAIDLVESGNADGVILPVENSTMGRIADIHALLPQTHLKIVGEAYLPVTHCLLGLKTLSQLGIQPENGLDTAGSAKLIAEKNDPTLAAIASSLAAEVYGLKILKSPMNDHPHNTTRFLLLGHEGWLPPLETPVKTTLLYKVKDIPAALYKSLGGFAANNINLSRLESYLVGGSFNAAEFFIDVEAHPLHPSMQSALEELSLYAPEIRLMGTYPAAPGR